MTKVAHYCDLCKKEAFVGFGEFNLQINGEDIGRPFPLMNGPYEVCSDCHKILKEAISETYRTTLEKLRK
jgi:hypothetical protein